MKSKKVLSIFLTAVLAASVLVGCGTTSETEETPTNQEQQTEDTVSEAKYEDGFYYAAADEFGNGWKYNVTIEVKDGKIVDAEWNGMNIAGGKDKVTLAADGEYGMLKASEIGAEWHDQAEKVADHLIETQDPTAIEYTDEDGHTEAISGATIKVKTFFELADKALQGDPIEKGDYKDGYYNAEAPKDSFGEIPMIQLVVVNGRIVDANFNYIMDNKEGELSDKKTISINGEYDMDPIAIAPIYEQLAMYEKYLADTQTYDLNYIDEDGRTDAISGASIHVREFFTLVEPTLNGEATYPIFN